MERELLVTAPDGSVQTLLLQEEPVSLGRAQDNDLCYAEDASLSRSHLLLERSGENWFVRDLGSKNGTFVNGARVKGNHRLSPGDRIEAGQVVLRYGRLAPQASTPVVFLPEAAGESPPSETIMTSLDLVLSRESTTREPSGGPPRGGGQARGPSFGPVAVRALIDAGKELARNRPLPDLFRLILDLSLTAVGAERGAIMSIEGGELAVRAVKGEDLRISSFVRDRVLEEKASLLVRDTRLDDALRERESIYGQQIRSIMAVPLQTEDRVIGMVYVDSRFMARGHTPDELNLLTVLANVAATRIEHQRLAEIEQMEQLYERDLKQAAEIQRRLLPGSAPDVRGLDLAGYNAPCRMVGGDYYDFFICPEGWVAVALGDVSGKGMSAALLASSLQARVQVLAEECHELGRFMSRLDRAIAASSPDNRFVSLFFGVIRPETGAVRYSNAGHNPPMLVRRDGTVERLAATGTILGILPELGYEERLCQLDPDDLLVLYSDGVTEALGVGEQEDEEFGEERLAALLIQHRGRPSAGVIEAVMSSLRSWTGDTPAADDITLVAVRRTASS